MTAAWSPRALDRDGLRLRYSVTGDGPAVLCLHGATGTGMFEWAETAVALASGYRCVVPDLRGHGESDHRPGSLTMDELGEDLQALITHESLDRPHLVAFSFGAELALSLELRQPGTAATLVLISPGLGHPSTSVPTREQLVAAWPRPLRSLHVRHGEDHWLDLMLELCAHAAAMPELSPEALATIDCPILLILGSNDDRRRRRQARTFEEANGRCTLVEVPDAGHAAHKQRPEVVGPLVRQFLDAQHARNAQAGGARPVPSARQLSTSTTRDPPDRRQRRTEMDSWPAR